MYERIGRPYASVLPEPVCAMPTMSRSTAGAVAVVVASELADCEEVAVSSSSVRLWISVGLEKPSSPRARYSGLASGMCAQPGATACAAVQDVSSEWEGSAEEGRRTVDRLHGSNLVVLVSRGGLLIPCTLLALCFGLLLALLRFLHLSIRRYRAILCGLHRLVRERERLVLERELLVVVKGRVVALVDDVFDGHESSLVVCGRAGLALVALLLRRLVGVVLDDLQAGQVSMLGGVQARGESGSAP